MLQENILNLHPFYTFASPRYKAIKPINTVYMDEDYATYDLFNGTYDKYWSLYAVTDTEVPTLKLVLNDVEKDIKGDLALFLNRSNYFTKSVGATGYQHSLVNSTLETKNLTFNEYLQPLINPGWSYIQIVLETTAAFTGYFIRNLGTTETIRTYHAIDIDSDRTGEASTTSNQLLPKGFIINYQDKPYRAIRPTRTLPFSAGSLTLGADWETLENRSTVFHADVYSFDSEGNSFFIREVKDGYRQFDPIVDEDKTLVCWNIGYYHI